MNAIKRSLIVASAFIALAVGGANNSTTSTNIVLPSEDPYIVGFIEIPQRYRYKYVISSNRYLNSRLTRSHQTKGNFLEELVNFVNVKEHPVVEIASVFESWYRVKEERAQAILDYIHENFAWENSIEKENPGLDYIKYPIETLVEKCGDCEDLAILGASIMKSADLDVALLHLPKMRHVALGIAGKFEGTYYEVEGKKYFYVETSNDRRAASRFKIGEVPSNFGNSEAFVRPIKK